MRWNPHENREEEDKELPEDKLWSWRARPDLGKIKGKSVRRGPMLTVGAIKIK